MTISFWDACGAALFAYVLGLTLGFVWGRYVR